VKKPNLYNLDSKIFLSEDSLNSLKEVMSKTSLSKRKQTCLLNSYIYFFKYLTDIYGHSTSSLSLENILKDKALTLDSHHFSGEASVDVIARSRDFISMVKTNSIFSLFFLNIFSTYFVKRERKGTYLSFTADSEYPLSFLDDFKDIERALFPNRSLARVKKMLKLEKLPTEVNNKDLDCAYSEWKKIFMNREYFRTLERENLYIEAINILKEYFSKNILPSVKFENQESSDISIISKGLNIYSPHSLEDAKYHVLRSIYNKLIKDNIIPRYYLDNQEKYSKKICSYSLDLLREDGPYLSRIIKIEEQGNYRDYFNKVESQFPVILFFKFKDEEKKNWFNSVTKHMDFEVRSRDPISIKNISFVLVPLKEMQKARDIVKGFDIPLLPLEIVEMIRFIYKKNIS